MDHHVEFDGLNEDVLADLLCHFYAKIRQKDGSVYCMRCMFSVRRAMYRHLTGPPNNVKYNIGRSLHRSEQHIESTCCPLKAQWKHKSDRYPPIKEEDVRKMYESGVVGHSIPAALLHKVFYELYLNLRRHGRESLGPLKKHHVVLMKTAGRSLSWTRTHRGSSLLWPPGSDVCHMGCQQPGTKLEDVQWQAKFNMQEFVRKAHIRK